MKKLAIVGVVAVILIIGVWLWMGFPKPLAPASHGGSGAGSAPVSAFVPGTDRATARAEIVVTDERGPVAGALVRLAGPDGAVSVATTTTDGIAHASGLAPGSWTISAAAIGHLPAAATARTLAVGETANVAIVLVRGGRIISGLVTDTSGGPIVGARVDAAVLGGNAQPGIAVASALTGADGRYTLALGEGEATIAANHPDYAPQQRYVEIGDAGATVDFQLVPGGVIEGQVHDALTQAPVPNAHVDADLDGATVFGEASARHVIADDSGAFRFSGLRPGAYALTAHLDDRISTAPTIVGLGVAEQVTDVVLRVGHGVTVRGVVVDAAEQPVAGAKLSTFGGPEVVATSDDHGAFALVGVAPGRLMIGASDATHVSGALTVVEVATKDVDGVRVRVRTGVRVVGHVEPRQVCEVRFEPADERMQRGPRELVPVTTGADGAFTLGPIEPRAYTAHARCPSGDTGVVAAPVAVGMGELVVEVKPGASISGRVIDTKGKPIAGASVNAGSGTRTEITNGMVTSGTAAMTSASGAFELTGLAAGTFQLSVLDRGRPLPMKSGGTAQVALAAAEHKTGVELIVDRPDGVITGTVTAAGKPVADAWVSVDQSFEDMIGGMQGSGESHDLMVESRDDGGGASAIAPVLTDATGHFKITGLARGAWTVTAEAQAGALRGHVDKVVPDATITLPIDGVRELRGTVTGASTPPPWFAVQLEGPTSAERTFAWSEGTGAFAFARVDPGEYVVHVTSSAGGGDAKVTVGADGAHVEVALVTNAVITGTLVDKSGKPLPELAIAVVPDPGDGPLRIELRGPPPVSGPDGSFRVETKPGKVVLAVMLPNGPAIKPGLVAIAGQTLDIGPFVVVRSKR